MAVPVYEGVGTVSHAASMGTALTPTCPATVNANDVLAVWIVNRDTGSQTYSLSGGGTWTNLATINGTGLPQCHIFYKLADGTEDGATVTCTATGGTVPHKAAVYRFSGTATSSFIAYDNAEFGNTSTINDNDVTTDQADCLALNFVADGGSDASPGNPTGETGGDWVEAHWSNVTANPSIGLWRADMASAGTVGGGSVTLGAARNTRVLSVFLRAAIAAGGQPAVKRMGGVPFASPNRGVW